MPTKMFAKHLTSVIVVLLLSFLPFKEGRFEAVGEFDIPYWTWSFFRLWVSWTRLNLRNVVCPIKTLVTLSVLPNIFLLAEPGWWEIVIPDSESLNWNYRSNTVVTSTSTKILSQAWNIKFVYVVFISWNSSLIRISFQSITFTWFILWVIANI